MGEFLFALMFDLIVFGPVVVTACYNVLFESKGQQSEHQCVALYSPH